MGSKVTCTTCGKVWTTRDEYLKDGVKCGKDTCPLLDASMKNKEKAQQVHTRKRTKEPELTYGFAHVCSKIDPENHVGLYRSLEVPRILTARLRMA